MIYGKEMCDQESVDLEESNAANLKKKEVDSILINASGGVPMNDLLAGLPVEQRDGFAESRGDIGSLF